VKKRYLIISLFAASLAAQAQKHDSLYTKKELSKTDVQLLFSFYTQDNDHSAVTGGTGTEDLQVYTTQVAVHHEPDSFKTYHISAGVDLISSASTDKIDFEMSSASKTDFRGYFKVGYDRHLLRSGFTIGASLSGSIESDYRSLGPAISMSHVNHSRSRELSLALQAYFDNLLWYDDGEWNKLVYPQELRYKEWFDIYTRTSYNASLGIYQTINRKMALGLYPGISYQEGLLSTPFHRVYFTDRSLRVENLPRHRLKIPIGVQLNTFVGRRCMVRTSYRYYWDDFGIEAHTVSVEVPLKLTPAVSLTPFARYYTQTRADFFKPYGMHDATETFYISDYDLSSFNSVKAGIGFRRTASVSKTQQVFKAFELRYALYSRSDGLVSHTVTLFFDWNVEKLKDHR
jgi:hypothetical protein